MSEKEEKHITSTYYMPKKVQTRLKAALALQGKSISEWMTEKAKEEIIKAGLADA
jgi:hypothetical protein